MRSFIPGKRTRLFSLAAAGTLSMAGAISMATLTVPSAASAASAGSASAGSMFAGAVSDGSVSAAPAVANLEAVTQQRSSRGAAQQADGLRETQLAAGTRQYAARQAIAEGRAVVREQATVKERAAARQAAARKRRAAAGQAKAAAVARKRAAKALSGSPQQIAQTLLGQFGWSASQFACLQPLWGQESGWSVSASNPGSGAYGIPQALPGSRMSSAGPDWQTSAATQIKWGLQYIQSTYGSPCGAWSHEQSAGWY